MNLDEQALKTARQVFMAHRDECRLCSMYVFGQTKTFTFLCLYGIDKLKEMLACEDVIVKKHKNAEFNK